MWPVGRHDNNYDVNGYNYNNRASRGIVCQSGIVGILLMKTYTKLYKRLCSFENLQEAYEKAKRRKSANPKIAKFEEHWQLYLCLLMKELKNKTYSPAPLRSFVIRDPKTRTICVSQFRDRIVHHALVNVLQPIFEPRFIYDSHATRKGKGTHAALKRFDVFMRKVSKNGRIVSFALNANAVEGFVLKADIKKYFETVDHKTLLAIIGQRIRDQDVLWLVKTVLDNYDSGIPGRGMPLGNWTSQFFANIYLNELDQFVKHRLKAKYYMRYVDDFVILHHSKRVLEAHVQNIQEFLFSLKLELHPTKCKIIPLNKGVSFLGFRVFYHYKLVRQRNIRSIVAKLYALLDAYKEGETEAGDIFNVFQGWVGYAMHGNTYGLRKEMNVLIKRELESRTRAKNI